MDAPSKLEKSAPDVASPVGVTRRPLAPRGTATALRQAVPLTLMFLGWEALSRSLPGLAMMLPPPSEVAVAAIDMVGNGSLFKDVWASLRRVFIALLIAVAIGLPLGVLIGMSARAAWLLEPIIGFFRPIPPLAWIPLSIVWFGVTEAQNVYIIFLGAFFPILVNTVQGVREVDRQLVRAARTLGAKPHEVALTVLLPAATPAMFVGVRVGTGIAWMALVAGELVAASSGLGFLIMQGRMLFRPDFIIVGMVVIGVIGLILDAMIRYLQKTVMKWQEY